MSISMWALWSKHPASIGRCPPRFGPATVAPVFVAPQRLRVGPSGPGRAAGKVIAGPRDGRCAVSILVTHGSLRGGAAGIAGERPTEVKEGPPRAVRPLPWAGVWLSAVALLGAAAASIATLAWDGAFPPP